MWADVLDVLREQVTPPSFDTWLQDTVGIDLTVDGLTVSAPDWLTADTVLKRWERHVDDALDAVRPGDAVDEGVRLGVLSVLPTGEIGQWLSVDYATLVCRISNAEKDMPRWLGDRLAENATHDYSYAELVKKRPRGQGHEGKERQRRCASAT